MNERCQDVMTGDPVCCTPDDSVQRAAQLMKQEDIGPILVCDSRDSKKLVGIVTDRDLAVKVVAEGRNPESTRVGDIMSRELHTCRPEDDLETALQTMQERQVRRIPVVDRQNRVVGIIAQADVATRLDEANRTAEVVEEISKPRTMRA
jgi:CBS domain-containing protein